MIVFPSVSRWSSQLRVRSRVDPKRTIYNQTCRASSFGVVMKLYGGSSAFHERSRESLSVKRNPPPLATLLCFQVLFPNMCDWQAGCWGYPCPYCFLFDQSPWWRCPSVRCNEGLNPSLASPQGADVQWVWVGPHCLGWGTLHTQESAPPGGVPPGGDGASLVSICSRI